MKETVEFFAKSKKKYFKEEEIEKIIAVIEETRRGLEEELEDWEKAVIDKQICKIQSEGSEERKTLQDHQNEIVECCQKFFAQYGTYFTEKERLLILEACRRHDWGKANLLFQNKILPESERKPVPGYDGEREIPHGFLSGVSISKEEFLKISDLFEKADFKAFITALYYHHAREDYLEREEIEKYCKRFYTEQIREYLGIETWDPSCRNIKWLLFRNNPYKKNIILEKDIWKWQQYLVIKGILNKMDYTVSAGFSEAEENSDLIKKELVKNISAQFRKKRLVFRPVQEYMRNHTEESQVIIAPTGAGKTEAALLWLNGEKGFYTLPLKVSSDAVYKRIKEEYSYKNAAILHSDSMQSYLREYAETDRDGYVQYEKVRMLSAPLTVCTVDQLLKFVYKAPGTEMLAATLKYSKLVIDEIQSYSPRVIATIIYGLKTVHELGGRFLIMTATFPPVLQHFMRQYGLEEGVQYQFQNFASASETFRHKAVVRNGDFDIEEIIDQGKSKKVLVICNTVSKAQELYDSIEKMSDKVYLLHSRYLRRDRGILERKIMEFSQDLKAKGIWITTQIVEASLDIDFDMLYTEMCTADSLLQRMGRCNRKSRYQPETANIMIYANENGIGDRNVYSRFLYERSLDMLRQYENQIFTETMKVDYIHQVYDTDAVKQDNYYKEIDNFLKHFDVVGPWDYTKKDADQKFRNINSITIVPDSEYQKHQELFDAGMELIKHRQIGREMKSLISTRLNASTININIYYGKMPEGVDTSTIGEKDGRKVCNIHRARLFYDFDSAVCRGKGLLLNKVEDEECFV